MELDPCRLWDSEDKERCGFNGKVCYCNGNKWYCDYSGEIRNREQLVD